VEVAVDDPTSPEVGVLLADHMADMKAISPPGSMHALDADALSAPGVTFWAVRDGGVPVGCGALKELSAEHGELKSMRTIPSARGRGIAGLLLTTLLDEARRRGYRRVSLETGPHDFFAPALRLYERHGFTRCAPFADYVDDPHSVYLTLELPPAGE
jgi:putative acetyltransferase